MHGTPNLTGDNVDTIQVNVNDNGNTGSGDGTEVDLGTVNVNISAVNDNPSNAGDLPDDITVTEDQLSNVDLSLMDLSDVDADGGELTVTLTTGTGGQLTGVTGSTGITLGGTSSALTVKGTLADLNNYFDNVSSIQYVHGTPNLTGDNVDTIQVNVNDNGNTGSGDGTEVDLGTVNVNISAVNDNPSNVGDLPDDITVTEDVQSNVDLSLMDLSDVDADGGELTVTLTTGTGGQLTGATGSTGITLGGTSSALTVKGTLADLNNYFDNVSSIQYVHGTPNLTGDNVDTIQVNVNDNGNTGSGDGTEVDLGTVNVNISAVNDNPSNAGDLPDDITVTEDVQSNVDLSLMDLSDVDADGGELTVTLTTGTGGQLTGATGSTGITLGGTSSALTVKGTLADLNNYFDNVSSIQYVHGTPNLTGDNVDTIQVNVNDNGNTGSGDGAEVDLGTIKVDVIAVNDPPVNNVPGTQTATEETTAVINGISVSDVDANGANITTRLQVTDGVLNIAPGSANIITGTNNSADITLSGSVSEINAMLASLNYTGNTDVTGIAADTLTITTNDNGNTGSGGALIDSASIQIDILAVNDSPVVTAPVNAYEVDEQTSLAIHGTGFTVSDIDAANDILSATLTVEEGTLSVVGGNSGISISSGNASESVVVTGTLSQIDNLLTGASNGTIAYSNNSDTPAESTRLILTVNDGSQVGADQNANNDTEAEQNSASQIIRIIPINDSPFNSGSLPTDIAVIEDVISNLDLSLIEITDVDAASGNLTVSLNTVNGGNLTASNAPGVTVSANDSTVSITGSLQQINNYLDNPDNIKYLHGQENTEGNNADLLRLSIDDNGNTGINSEGEIDLGSINIDIGSINDAPTVAVPGVQIVQEDVLNKLRAFVSPIVRPARRMSVWLYLLQTEPWQ